MHISGILYVLVSVAMMLVPGGGPGETPDSSPAAVVSMSGVARGGATPAPVQGGVGVEQAGSPPSTCIDTILCGSCCGSKAVLRRFVECCQDPDAFDCAQQAGCQ